jgi:hypothetical protein
VHGFAPEGVYNCFVLIAVDVCYSGDTCFLLAGYTQHADMKHPPGLSEIVLRQADSATRVGAVKKVRLYANSRSKLGAKPSDPNSVLLFDCNVQTAANKDDIATRAADISGLSAFALGESVHLRLRRKHPSKASLGEWKGPGKFPDKWFTVRPQARN